MTLSQQNALKSVIKELRNRLETDDFISEWGRDVINNDLFILKEMLDSESK